MRSLLLLATVSVVFAADVEVIEELKPAESVLLPHEGISFAGGWEVNRNRDRELERHHNMEGYHNRHHEDDNQRGIHEYNAYLEHLRLKLLSERQHQRRPHYGDRRHWEHSGMTGNRGHYDRQDYHDRQHYQHHHHQHDHHEHDQASWQNMG